ncbi:MAG: xanthine dehydrogenase family protein molybdopterin-binding subunit, partial [Rhodospirillaceae bacterium]
MNFSSIGSSVLRSEDLRRLTGKASYTDDLGERGAVRAWMVRSPHPHAEINSINVANAQEVNGVVGVLTIDDWLKDGLNPIP